MKPLNLAILIAILLVPVIALGLTKDTSSTNDSTVPTPTPSSSATYTDPADAVSASIVLLKTDKGDIKLSLFPDKAPLSVKNFVTLGKRGYYTGTFFHRIMKDFMIQGGDPEGTGMGGQSIYGTGFATETSDKKFKKGTLGMARSSDPNSNGSQFFIVTATDQPSLDGSYTVFGEVADQASMDVVTAIAATPVTAGATGESSTPTEQIKVTGFEIVE